MQQRLIKAPGPDHPITIEPAKKRIVISFNGVVVADTSLALALKEASYPVVYYIPKSAVNMQLLKRSEHTTYCPYKGVCSYYSFFGQSEKAVNAVWSYENPFPAVETIRDHLAFYADRVVIVEMD